MNIAILGPSTMVHVRRLVPALAARGHNLHVVSMKSEPIAGATFERFAVPRPSLRYPYRWRRRWKMYIKGLFKRFDVVTVHFLSDWLIDEDTVGDGVLISRAYGSDVDPPPETPLPTAQLVRARKTLLECSNAIVTPSHWFGRRLIDYAGIDGSRMTTILGGVDTDVFAPALKTRRSDRPVIGYFKGFEPVYAPLTLVEAIPLVLARHPDARFDLVGAGRHRTACQHRAAQLNIDHAIRWLDPVPNTALPAIMAGWDVVAISSVKESFCVAAIEASAMELPVVATRVGGLPEAVADGETGLLVEPRNSAALAGGLVTLLDNPERRRAMGVAGRRRVVERFHWDREVGDWVKLYRELRPGRRSAPKPPASLPGLISTGAG